VSKDRGGDDFLRRLEAEREPDPRSVERERSFAPPPIPRGVVPRGPLLNPQPLPGRYADDHAKLSKWAAELGWEPELAALALDGSAHVVIDRERRIVVTLCGLDGRPQEPNTGVAPCQRCVSFRRR
jgi:hypothetical protein